MIAMTIITNGKEKSQLQTNGDNNSHENGDVNESDTNQGQTQHQEQLQW